MSTHPQHSTGYPQVLSLPPGPPSRQHYVLPGSAGRPQQRTHINPSTESDQAQTPSRISTTSRWSVSGRRPVPFDRRFHPDRGFSMRAGTGSVVGSLELPAAVGAGADGGLGSGVDRDSLLVIRDDRKLEGALFKALCDDHPAHPIEEQERHHPAAAVEERVQVAVLWIEAKAAHAAGEGVERPAHVHRIDGQEHANRQRERQHRRTARTTRTSASSSNVASISTRRSP